MTTPMITVICVSWRSTRFLERLFSGLLHTSARPESITFLVADNTNGADPKLAELNFPNLTIVPVDVQGERMSMAHAIGLNALLPLVDTSYALIIDPDIAMLQPGWDAMLCSALETGDYVAIGAPYPAWKFGKYHDFPSPPFAFWHTVSFRSLDPDWRPYGRTTARRLADFCLRQAFWGPRILNRVVWAQTPRSARVGGWVERLVGVVSKDTGWEIAHRARQRQWHALLFDVVGDVDKLEGIPPEQRPAFRELAQVFELYTWQGRPFISHRNPTWTQFGLNLWTNQNVTLYQNQAAKETLTERWFDLIDGVTPFELTRSGES